LNYKTAVGATATRISDIFQTKKEMTAKHVMCPIAMAEMFGCPIENI